MNEVELGFPAMTFEAGWGLSHRKMVRMHGPRGTKHLQVTLGGEEKVTNTKEGTG